MSAAPVTTSTNQVEPLTAARLGLSPEPRTAGTEDDATAHVRAALDTQLRVLLDRQDAAGRRDDPEAVHQMRVAIRRMRAVLRTSGADPELRAELSWLGGALGTVRDLDVLAEGLTSAAATLSLPDREAFSEIESALRAFREVSVTELTTDLASERYRRLLATLAVRTQTATVPPADRNRTPEALVRKPLRAFDRKVGALGEVPTPDQLHRVRISGKRLRYAAELARSLSDEDGSLTKVIKAARNLQDLLGRHHDTVAAESYLRGLVGDSPVDLSPHALVVVGRLIEREITLRADYERRWHASARKLHRAAASFLR